MTEIKMDVKLISVKTLCKTNEYEREKGFERLAIASFSYYDFQFCCSVLRGINKEGNPFDFVCMPYRYYRDHKSKKLKKLNFLLWASPMVSKEFQKQACEILKKEHPEIFKIEKGKKI